jgi:hypothetical protein
MSPAPGKVAWNGEDGFCPASEETKDEAVSPWSRAGFLEPQRVHELMGQP